MAINPLGQPMKGSHAMSAVLAVRACLLLTTRACTGQAYMHVQSLLMLHHHPSLHAPDAGAYLAVQSMCRLTTSCIVHVQSQMALKPSA